MRRQELGDVATGVIRTCAQLALYAAFGFAVVALSGYPPYARIDSDSAVVKLNFSHPARAASLATH